MPKTPKVKFSYKKHNGDDAYSWAVFRNDMSRPIVSGENRSSAKCIKETLEKEYKEGIKV